MKCKSCGCTMSNLGGMACRYPFCENYMLTLNKDGSGCLFDFKGSSEVEGSFINKVMNGGE